MRCGTWIVARKWQWSGIAALFFMLGYLIPAILNTIPSASYGTHEDGRLQGLLHTLQSKAYRHLNSTSSPVLVGQTYRETNVVEQTTSLKMWLKKQEEIRSHVASICELHKDRVKQTMGLKHILVNDRYKVLYCYVPKVGCTTWKTIFQSLAEGYEYLRIPKGNINHGYQGYHSLRNGEMAAVANYTKFMLVRDPFERLVSLYREKVERNGNSHYFGKLGRKPTFSEFIEYYVQSHPKDEHIRSHVNLCCPCDIHYDVIGKYETFRRDSLYILEFLFNMTPSKAAAYMTALNQNKGPPTRDLTEEYWSQVPRSMTAEMISTYKDDFVMFQYNSSRWESNHLMSNNTNATGIY